MAWNWEGVGQNGLSTELCGIISWDYCFKQEAYLKAKRARQSQNGQFPNDYHNWKKGFVKETNSLVKWTGEVLENLKRIWALVNDVWKQVTQSWAWSTVVLFFQVTSLGLVPTTATDAIMAELNCCTLNPRSLTRRLDWKQVDRIHYLLVLCFDWLAALQQFTLEVH